MTMSADDTAVVLPVRVKPRASSTRVAGERAGRLLVEVNAPPVEGRANDALCRLLAKAVGVAPSAVSLVAGERGRDKLVRIEGVPIDEVQRCLGLPSR
jgi:uncharacterized protein (TIGR00251 family)